MIFWLVVGLGFGLVFGLGGGLVVWLVVALVVALVVEDPSFDPVDAIGIDWHRLPDALLKWGLGSGLMVALVVALVVGLGSGLVGELGGGLIGGLGGGLVVWLGGALAITLAVAMVVGLLIFIGMGGEGEGLGSRLGAGLFGGLFLGLITGFVLSVTFGVFGLAFALVFGLFGELGGLVGGLVGGVVFGLVVGLGVGLGQILRPAAVSERSAANEGTSRSLRYALRISSAGVVLAIAMAWLLSVLRGGTEGAISDAVKAAFAFTPALVASAAVLLAQIKGGFFVLSHWAVRAQLQRFDLAPRRYVKFLDEAADMLFLRKTGGAYQFFHVTFRDFVAETYGAEWLTKAPTTPESEQTAAAN